MIGSFSHISYTKFALVLAPVALVGLVVTVALVALLHREEFAGTSRLEAPRPDIHVNRVLVIRAVLVDRRHDRAVLRRDGAGQGGNHCW